ncbi:hypothetical protein NE619_18335, partial [Anaerovorax odorimutans]
LQPHIPGFRAVLAPLSLPGTLQPHNFPQQIAQIASNVVEKSKTPLFYISPNSFSLLPAAQLPYFTTKSDYLYFYQHSRGFWRNVEPFPTFTTTTPGLRAVLAPCSLPDTLQPHNFPQQIAQIAAD